MKKKDILDVKLENLFQTSDNIKRAIKIGSYLMKKEIPDSSRNQKRLKQIKKNHGY